MRVFNPNMLYKVFLMIPLFACLLFPTLSAAKRACCPSKLAVVHDAWFLGVGGGASWLGLASNDYVNNGSNFSYPYNRDIYSINNGLITPIAQLSAGYVRLCERTFFPYMSAYIQYRHYFSAKINGSIDQYSLPEFQNYNYTMDYEANLFTLNGKLGLFKLQTMIPYVAGGIGFIINHVDDYSESAKPGVTPRVSPAYQGQSQTQLALTLGAGLEFLINKCTTATLGYEHVFQNTVKSGPGTTTWADTNLNFGKIKLDTVFINIAVNFPH